MQMMRHVIAPAVLAFTMASAVPSQAADLSVNGQIRSDGACSIALGNGGVVDLGSLTRNQLSPPGELRVYEGREMSLMINCPHPTKVSVTATDNREGTAHPGYYDWHGFGLGNPTIGFYFIRINETPSMADGRDAFVIKPTYSVGWYDPGNGDTMAPCTTISWGVDGPPLPEAWQKEPVAFKALTSTLGINIAIALRKDVGFIDGMELDGSMTLELGYL
ncbi:DUF1120 domain-containing protein [Burkholderia sp. NLJ2]|uniref:DUF1120 domain-containing protein n=1 Tax=Burkholderia sp. NLJ2 TaxID=3090699 RepID=UPI003C6BF26C